MTLLRSLMKVVRVFIYAYVTWGIAQQDTHDIGSDPSLYFSRPISDIHMDGLIDDWPANTDKYVIDRPIWQSSERITEDYHGYFMMGHNFADNSIYIAVVTHDEEDIQEKGNIEIGDLYVLFLDESHDEKGSGILRYKISSNDRNMTTEDQLWDDALKERLDWDDFEYRVTSIAGTTTYEIKIQIQHPLYEGRILGMGHLVQDVDSDNETVYAWVGRGDKDYNAQPGRMGRVMLVSEESLFGKLKGQVAWRDGSQALAPEGIRIVTSKGDWLYQRLDENGKFEIDLPYGNYVLKPGKTAFFEGSNYRKADVSKTKRIVIDKPSLEEDYHLSAVPKPKFDFEKGLLKSLHNPDKQAYLDAMIRAFMDYYEIQGASFGAILGDSLVYSKPYGMANAYTERKVTSSTLFEVASITKTVFSYLVLRLHQKGLIDLDQPMFEMLEFDAIAHSPYAKLLTPRLILSHQTGLPNWGNGGRIEFKFKPGTAFGYSGEAYEYLKRYMERITEKSVDQLFREEVIEPLQLNNFFFKYDPRAFEHKSHGHYNGFPGIKDLPEYPWVAGCLVTNVDNLAKFLIALKNGKGLEPDTYEMMLSNHIAVPQAYRENNWNFEEYMGLGVFIEQAPYGKVLRHSGNNGDFKATYRLYQELDMGYLIMTNGNTGDFVLDAIEPFLLDYKKKK